MDMIEQLRALATRIANTKSLIQTEEATKNAMVMPFIQILGYNVFDPTEVTPFSVFSRHGGPVRRIDQRTNLSLFH